MGSSPEQQSTEDLQPLTHRKETGQLLQREPEVEDQIRSVLVLPSNELLERARIADRQEAGYLQEETLVCLIRAHHSAGDKAMTNALSDILIRRCARFIYGKFRKLGMEDVDEGYDTVVAHVFGQILDTKRDRGDFLQVRFWLALDRIVISVFRSYISRSKADQEMLIPLSDEEDDENAQRSESISSSEIPDSAPSLDQAAIVADALCALDEPYRTAIILRYKEEWQIESNDPNELTLSKYFQKTPRTIRNWLREAEKALEKWRGQSYG